MPRRARLAVPGIAWHITHRGDNRSPRLYSDDDYRKHLRILGEQARTHGCVVRTENTQP